jgi:hypothetical protein
MKPSDLHFDPNLTPERDENFIRHMSAALDGTEPIYFAAVPTSICIPFDRDYRPDLHPVGAEAIKQAAERGKKGEHQNLIVYQRGYWFIVSDDYIPYFGALTGMPDYLPCLILGKPDHPLVKDLQGPIDPKEFKKYIGL